MRLAPRMIKWRWATKPYLISYMLFSEWMVAEQARIYSKAQGLYGPRYWAISDFVYRLGTKGVLRVYENLFQGVFKRFFAPRDTRQAQIALQMGDERVVAHRSSAARALAVAGGPRRTAAGAAALEFPGLDYARPAVN